eukprot:9878460-Lingulodinium_polyedra.AAC.1
MLPGARGCQAPPPRASASLAPGAGCSAAAGSRGQGPRAGLSARAPSREFTGPPKVQRAAFG